MYTHRKNELWMSADEFHGQLFSRLSALLLCILAPALVPRQVFSNPRSVLAQGNY